MTSQQLFVPCGCLELVSADSINFNRRVNPPWFVFCEIPFTNKGTGAAMRPATASGKATRDTQVSHWPIFSLSSKQSQKPLRKLTRPSSSVMSNTVNKKRVEKYFSQLVRVDKLSRVDIQSCRVENAPR